MSEAIIRFIVGTNAPLRHRLRLACAYLTTEYGGVTLFKGGGYWRPKLSESPIITRSYVFECWCSADTYSFIHQRAAAHLAELFDMKEVPVQKILYTIPGES